MSYAGLSPFVDFRYVVLFFYQGFRRVSFCIARDSFLAFWFAWFVQYNDITP